MNSTQISFLKVPLIRDAHIKAQQFAAQQATIQKGKHVYLNTLAVYAVHCYLKWRQIETDLEQGDSWKPDLQVLYNVADLLIIGIGRLECCLVLPGETTVALLPGLMEDRIAYVAVQFGEHLDQVELLGFTPAADITELPEELPIENFQPIENLFDYLQRIKGAVAFLTGNDPVVERVRLVLGNRSISEVVAQLEQIYRTETDEDNQRYEGGKVLAGSRIPQEILRGSIDEDKEVELQDLVEELMEKLAAIWKTQD